jgi:hypothetical protein
LVLPTRREDVVRNEQGGCDSEGFDAILSVSPSLSLPLSLWLEAIRHEPDRILTPPFYPPFYAERIKPKVYDEEPGVYADRRGVRDGECGGEDCGGVV